MLDGQRRLETAQGFRGPATRFFGPIENTTATTVIREMCLGLLAIALVVAVASVKARALGAVAGVVIAVPAVALYLSRNRIAAVALLVSVFLLSSALFMLGSIRGLGALFIWFAWQVEPQQTRAGAREEPQPLRFAVRNPSGEDYESRRTNGVRPQQGEAGFSGASSGERTPPNAILG